MKRNLLLYFYMFAALLGYAQTLTDSNLPIVIITTDNKQAIPNDPKIGATMKIIYHPDGSRNYVTDQNNPLVLNYSGRIQIEQRGSSSAGLWYKKPYGFNTVQADNVTNNNVSLLGMPKDNDWVLNSFADDESYMRDYVVYNLSNSIGQYASRGMHCEIIVNDVYYGIYMLTEQIKVGADRVNITKMSANDTADAKLTGGYITQCDRANPGEQPAWQYPNSTILNYVDFVHVSPKSTLITSKQNDYIKSQFDALTAAASQQNSSVANGFPSIIDVPTFVDFMIINELTSNVDAYQFSTYFHKDRNGKLRAGPVWDFNRGCGLDIFANGSITTGFQVTDNDGNGADFWRDLFNNPTFYCYFAKRWEELSAPGKPLNYTNIAYVIDSVANRLYEARSGRLGRDMLAIDTMKTWFQDRVNWLNTHVKSAGCQFPTVHPLVISKIHYNPLPSGTYTSNQLEFIELTNNSASPIDVSGYYFRELGLTYIFPNNSIIPANGKIYLSSNASFFSAFYSANPFGEYSRTLSNTSEKLVLADAYGNIVDEVQYLNVAPWPTAANGTGAYLKLKDVSLDNSLASSWVAANTDAVGTEELTVANATSIFPNPTNDQITVNSQQTIYKYEIYDQLGRLVKSENNVQATNFSINLNALAADTYVLKTFSSNQSTTFHKLIKY